MGLPWKHALERVSIQHPFLHWPPWWVASMLTFEIQSLKFHEERLDGSSLHFKKKRQLERLLTSPSLTKTLIQYNAMWPKRGKDKNMISINTISKF